MSSNPDLSSVLRTLSAFANPSNPAPASDPTAAPTAAPTTAPEHKTNNEPPHHKHQYQQQHQQQQQQQQKQNHPSTITTWPTALKHIMHLVSNSRTFSAHIQHLIKSQHDHERQWWAGREALVAKQRTRGEKKRRLEEVLKSVGAPIASAGNATDGSGGGGDKEVLSPAQENATELLAYDTKVLQASLDMSRAMETELRRLGVPFFCLDVSSSTSASASASASAGASSSALSKDELDALKKRVLDLLVDLCT